MGLILARLSAVIKEKHRNNHKYRHITLVEEAHRLLSKVEFGDSGAKKGAVETFTDLLAEVRKYGEGLIIVDQIPNKLASEVIKNTNTKIIHKILARDDKETVGDAMLMDAKQKTFLSALETGEAVAFTEGLLKPVHVAIRRATDTNGAEIDTNKAEIYDSKVREEYLSWMERTHPRILAENSVINELYTEFNRQLNLCLNQSDRSEIKTGKGLMTEFSLRIAEFRENYKYDTEALPSDTLSSGNICRLLAKEKIKRMLADNILYERLVQFAERHLLGNTDIKELEDAPFGNLKRVITTIGMNV